MSTENVVIVESPSKAKTINKYLGKDYTVLASFGHVRDLPAKEGSVKPDEDFTMEWQNNERASKALNEILKSLKKAKNLFLATDPDREGEAISWHVQQILREKKMIDGLTIKRVTFNQITKTAVQEAFAQARQLDQNLIDAYLARRALDYLVGFTLSPVLWRKLPGSRSAGRVQSVALRLICQREAEIEIFKADEYWSIEAALKNPAGQPFTARLTHLKGEKLDKLSIGNETAAKEAQKLVEKGGLNISNVEKKQTMRHPRPPFITSTLQQEASRKLGFGASKTMRVAQQLYEGIEIGGETTGLITYMRTDGITLSPEAVTQSRKVIEKDFGAQYVPEKPRIYKSSAKNAQEAHEAIRPTSLERRPEQMRKFLNDEMFRLYDLIWKRTIASNMASAVLDQVAADIENADKSVVLRANGSVIAFDGFLKLYREGFDDNKEDDNDQDRLLPPLSKGDQTALEKVNAEQHFTQPPPRYSEASLVKALEELGIGRPSTYASILQVLQDRDYVRLEQKRFTPEDRGRIVTAFLESFFARYVEYDFTAKLEEQLDEITAGQIEWKDLLRDFWKEFSSAIDGTKDLTITEVIDTLNAELEAHFFPTRSDGADPRKCPSCDDGRLGLKLGKFGSFIGCTNYPDCRYTRPLAVMKEGEGDSEHQNLADGGRLLGIDPKTSMNVTLRQGPYGPYVQLGPKDENDKEEKPRRTPLPKGLDMTSLDLDKALGLLSLPREIGTHPETGKAISAGIGRFGPYIKHENVFKSVPKDEDVLTIGMNRAMELLDEAIKKKADSLIKDLGKIDGKPTTVNKGRFGPFIKQGRTMASIPKDIDPANIDVEKAKELLGKAKTKDKKKKAK